MKAFLLLIFVSFLFISCNKDPEQKGCCDPIAENYDPGALEDDGSAVPPPYRLVENEFSLLDVTDLVFVKVASGIGAGIITDGGQRPNIVPERAAATFTGFDGPSTLAAAIDRFVCLDLVVHGWDLAMATGQDPALPDDLAEAALRVVATYPTEVWGTPQFFADKMPSSPDEPAYLRLVKLVGREASVSAPQGYPRTTGPATPR